MRLLNADGSQQRWDGGFRAPGTLFVPGGGSADLRFPLSGLDLGEAGRDGRQLIAVFALLQESVAWYGENAGDGECRVIVVQ